jgi:GxxExxY protein
MEPQSRGGREGNAEELNAITATIIGSAIAVHRQLGPGLLESVYETCLAYELSEAGLSVQRQVHLPIRYRGVTIDGGYRIDLLVADQVVVEVKAVKSLESIHEAQLLTYLKLSDCRVGLLLNFNVELLKDGIRRLANGFPDLCVTSAPSAALR